MENGEIGERGQRQTGSENEREEGKDRRAEKQRGEMTVTDR